ncbi:MAG: hypothetical protein CMF58_02990 [Lentimicrobiaceae bacterium]|nr:hypothetical protein [Lentimicrobiaceae bacterium]|tara:strand:- start:707 stop:3247 length:2541 start_codon:yes stop_codon:yes gene_type:complete
MLPMKKLVLIIIILGFTITSFGQAGTCEQSDPFCTSNIYTFPAGVNTGSAQSGPYYGCLGSTPNPAWYHMKIAIEGNINIFMYTTPSKDIDFICWGPFNDPIAPCASSLTANKMVDCSYSPSTTETCNIPYGQVGEYYILLITNYSNQACNITFEKQSGTGETDCTIVPPPVSNNGPLCLHDTLELYADTINNATYMWSGPAGFTSTVQNPVIYDVGFDNAGVYELVITLNGSPSAPVETIVSISALPTPEFSFNEACFGDTTFLIDESTIEPPTSQIAAWMWDFGDGQTGNNQNEDHIYGDIGIYDVTLTTSTGFMMCSRSITKSVNVYSAATVEAGNDITIPNGWDAQLDGEVSGGSGGYNLVWEPQNMLIDPTIVDPTTVTMGATQVFSLNVEDDNSGCLSSDSMTVIVTGGALAVTATASPTTICQDDQVNLNALPSGGSGNNQYSWTSNPPGFTASIKEPSDFPQVNTTYNVEVFDGQNTVNASVSVVVKARPIGNAGNDKPITIGTSTTLDGSSASGGTGDHSYVWTPSHLLENNTILHPQTIILHESTEFSFTINDSNGCSSVPDNMFVIAGGDALGVFPTSSADNNVICQGEIVDLFPNATGGGGNYTYSWTSDNGFTSNEMSPQVSPWETTIYTVEVDDSYTIVTGNITINVNHTPVVDLIPANTNVWGQDTIKVCVRDTVMLDATDPLNPPLMDYLWSTSATSPSITVSTNGSWVSFDSYWANAVNPATGCTGTGSITIFFDFDECSIGIDEEEISNSIKVIPNPASEYIEVTTINLRGTISINLRNVFGQIVWSSSINGDVENKEVISLKNLASGQYIVEVINVGNSYYQKVIKN